MRLKGMQQVCELNIMLWQGAPCGSVNSLHVKVFKAPQVYRFTAQTAVCTCASAESQYGAVASTSLMGSVDIAGVLLYVT
jgi:hypothetical protein